MRTLTALTILLIHALPSAAAAQPTVDGVVDALYGQALASDAEGDAQGQAPIDLKQLYLWHDSTDLYAAFTIKGNIEGTNGDWGKYVIYIDTTNDSQGATSDPWLRNVIVDDPHKPEYSINTWLDQPPYGPDRVEVWSWGAGAWSQLSGGVSAAARVGTASGSVIEIKLPRATIGNPQQIWVEVWTTGNGQSDNAQDTINAPAEDWNASDWTTTAVLKVSTAYQLSTASPDAGVPDLGPPDLGPPPDVSQPDVTTPDLLAPDSASLDSGPKPDSALPADSGQQPDGATGDGTGIPDGGPADGSPDAANGDTGPRQGEGCSCAAKGDLAGNSSLMLLALVFLRRRRTR